MARTTSASKRLGAHLSRIGVSLLLVIGSMSTSVADDLGALAHNLASSGDFRVRVAAALALGKSRSKLASGALMTALDDRHPAVRSAAAAGLRALGDRSAAASLRQHAVREPSSVVRSEMSISASALEQRGQAKVLIRIGEMRNSTGPTGDRLVEAFRSATRTRAAEVPGVEVLSDAYEGRSDVSGRRLPVVMVDGVINRLARSSSAAKVAVSARVEYVLRKVPDQSLRATMAGSAQALGSTHMLGDEQQLTQLQAEALDGAVQSAMRGAPSAFRAAANVN